MTPTTRTRQSGAALFVSLIILLLMTLLGVTAMQNTTLQERMAGNMRDRDLAFQAAEAALREGEGMLNTATLPSFNGSNGLYQPNPAVDADEEPVPPVWEEIDWNASDSRAYGGTLYGLAASPRYIIEELPASLGNVNLAADEAVEESGMYRITARAVGGSSDTVVILQSTLKR